MHTKHLQSCLRHRKHFIHVICAYYRHGSRWHMRAMEMPPFLQYHAWYMMCLFSFSNFKCRQPAVESNGTTLCLYCYWLWSDLLNCIFFQNFHLLWKQTFDVLSCWFCPTGRNISSAHMLTHCRGRGGSASCPWLRVAAWCSYSSVVMGQQIPSPLASRDIFSMNSLFGCRLVNIWRFYVFCDGTKRL